MQFKGIDDFAKSRKGRIYDWPLYGEFFHSKKQQSKANLMGFMVILSQYMVI